ncbi:aminodeoxychorismate synthase component I [Streptococcus catagoni]|uniref:aminodeoxychorismate synthase component I n=1 Tax=Streptococcus catagoni TaxID=2654874 RepID=UPI00140E1860|nr:aminodeoxychorismate synthase component I [Streptococcus catagoni]
MHRKTIIDFKDLGCRYQFVNPMKEMIAQRLEDVGQVIAEVEHYQKLGYYVVGYLSYEAARFFDSKLATHPQVLGQEYFAYFTVHDSCQEEAIPTDYQAVDLGSHWQSSTCQETYQKAIQTIHHEMRQGNTYQVNYTIQLTQELNQADSLAIYNQLVVEQGAGYNAYVAHDQTAIISASPELFFEQKGEELITRPMKGTTKRGVNSLEDKKEKKWLAQDPKNRSENMMIVDLLRNDMGKICKTGSISVTKLCDVEQYSTVWQMTSTIKGQLKENSSLSDILQALFPCGSITGAPKQATMAIINRLEPKPRGVYCGSLGICLPNGHKIFNVGIRTIQLFGHQAIYGAGGGITWDSNWQSEYEEVHQKTAVLYRKRLPFTLKTRALVQNNKLSFLEEHIKRLKDSASYFAYPFDEEKLRLLIAQHVKKLDCQTYNLGIELNRQGDFSLDIKPLSDLSESFLQADLCLQKLDLAQLPFAHFKTSHRPHLSTSDHEHIYHTAEGFLLETSIANLILEIDGQLYTPPLSLGILAGIFRQSLIDSGDLIEKRLTVEDLQKAEHIYGANSVRGLFELTLSSKALTRKEESDDTIN